MMNQYRIRSTFEREGQRQPCDTPEVLGNAYRRTYADRAEAEVIAKDMQDDLAEFGLDPSTEYTVVPVWDEVTIGDWTGPMETARALMDDNLCEQIYGLVGTEQEFADRYCVAHLAAFGEKFCVN